MEVKTEKKDLRITIPENLDYTAIFDAIRTRNGNLNIVCGKMNFTKEEL